MMHLLLNSNLLFMFQSQKMLEEKQAKKKEKEVEKMEKTNAGYMVSVLYYKM